MNIKLPTHWKYFNLDRYDGNTDLNEHEDIYVTQMSLYATMNTIFC